MTTRLARIETTLAVVAVALLACLFFGTAVSTSWARIAALQTIEPYAFAVHEQLLYNFAEAGRFFQTIHRGYDDAWTWSGHRSITLILAGYLYGLWPQAIWLSVLQIMGVMAGAVPAAALGVAALRRPAGILLGAGVYLASPAVMALALQDYQDLVFALPAIMVTLWAMRARRLSWVVVGAVVGCLPREESVPMVVAAAMITWDGRWEQPFRRWRRNVVAAVVVAGGWTAGMMLFFPVTDNLHDMPLASTFSLYLDPSQPKSLLGWPWLHSFYALAWAPLGALALASPMVMLPGVGAVLLHMTIPFGLGVDHDWGRHAHHMATAVPFFVAATIMGGGRIIRLAATVPPRPVARLLAPAVVLVAAGWAVHWDRVWASSYNLVPAMWAKAPEHWHPAWELVRVLPDDSVPVVPLDVSLAVSNRSRSYTFSESLLDKAPRLGLGAGTHLIVHRGNAAALAWGLGMPGAEIIGEADPFMLIAWDPGALDPRAHPASGVPLQDVPSQRYQVGEPGVLPGVPPTSPTPAPPASHFPPTPVGHGGPP